MKKILALTTLALSLCAVFTSCGESDKTSSSSSRVIPKTTSAPRTERDYDSKTITDSDVESDSAGDRIKDAVDGAGDAGKDILEGVENAGEDIIDGAGDAVDDVIDGLDGTTEPTS